MSITKSTTAALIGGTILSLALVAAPLHADDADMKANAAMTDANVAAMKKAAETDAMLDESAAMAEDATDMTEESVDEAAMAMNETMDADDTVAMIQQRLGTDAELGTYELSVVEMDGMYTITGTIDRSEDYATLQRVLGNLEGVDASMIDNRVTVQ